MVRINPAACYMGSFIVNPVPLFKFNYTPYKMCPGGYREHVPGSGHLKGGGGGPQQHRSSSREHLHRVARIFLESTRFSKLYVYVYINLKVLYFGRLATLSWGGGGGGGGELCFRKWYGVAHILQKCPGVCAAYAGM